MRTYLTFERPVAELESKLAQLETGTDENDSVSVDEEVKTLKVKARLALKAAYKDLKSWEKTQVARHPDRPHFKDYINELIDDFTPLAGDRYFGDDDALIGGPGRFNGQAVMIIGHEKGSDTESRLKHNFGMARPEGYRKAVRLMDMAEKFGLPILALVDTAGAYPGIGAEERGQSEAIARSTDRCLSLEVPMISTIIGEGGSGGAIAIAAANHVIMLEHSFYSVISPEGAASILWRDAAKAEEAASNMKITAQDLMELGIIDTIVPEPVGGAHRHREEMIQRLSKAWDNSLKELGSMSPAEIKQHRRDKYLKMSPM